MDLSFNIYNVIILLGCIQGILLAALFLKNKKQQQKSNLYLAALLLMVSLSNFKICLIDIGATSTYPILRFIPIIFPFLIPVLLYAFVQHLTNQNYSLSKKERWMFAPFFINATFQIILLSTFILKPEFIDKNQSYISQINALKEFFAIVFCLAILLAILKQLRIFQGKLLQHYTNLSGKNLIWLSNLIKAILILWLFWAIPYTYAYFQEIPLTNVLYPLWIGLSICIYWIGYSMFSRSEIFIPPTILKPLEKEENKPTSTETIDNHFSNILKIVSDDKLYADPNLNMNLLSEKMELSNGYLSQIINQKVGKNFFDFINEFRIEDVKIKLKDPEFSHYSILGIALESGFNSKSTFNAVFKKSTGTTPSSYRKH